MLPTLRHKRLFPVTGHALMKFKAARSPHFLKSYQKRLGELDDKFFGRNDAGGVWIAYVKNGGEYQVAAEDVTPFDHVEDKANEWEVEAYAQRRTTYSRTPIVDDTGTYLAAYVPLLRDGHVIGLMSAEYDEAPISDFQAIVLSSFWLSIAPAVLIAVIIAYVLAGWLLEPSQVLRNRSAADEEKWCQLTAKEKELANLLIQGIHSDKELAQAMGLSRFTVADYVKEITKKTGWSRWELGLAAMRLRFSATP